MSEHDEPVRYLVGECFGPCLLQCRQVIRYVEVDHEREVYRAECSRCGRYRASVDEVEDACGYLG